MINFILKWGIVASGLSALFWYKKLHPGQSLNPMPPETHGEKPPRSFYTGWG